MLLKINSTSVVPAGSSTLNVILLDDTGATPINTATIGTETTPENWFALKVYNGTTMENLTISSVAAGTTPADGEVVITFDNATNLVALGDILILSPGLLIPASTPFSKILNTASLDNGFTNLTPVASIGEVTIAPKAYTTRNQNYNFKLDIITKQGDTISTITTTTNDPITVNGLIVTKIVFEVTDPDTIYNSLETCNYSIYFFDALDNVILYEPSSSDVISVSFLPTN